MSHAAWTELLLKFLIFSYVQSIEAVISSFFGLLVKASDLIIVSFNPTVGFGFGLVVSLGLDYLCFLV